MNSVFRLLLLTLAVSLLPASRGLSIDTYPGSGVTIRVETLYQHLPVRGFSPIRITIANDSGKERTWHFQFTSREGFSADGLLIHETALTVEAGDTKRFDLMVPLVRGTRFARLTLVVTGHGTIAERRTQHFSTAGNGSYGSGFNNRTVAMSASLSNPNWGNLANVSGSSGKRSQNWIAGSAFSPAYMPADWRAYAGFDTVWLTDREWLATGAAERLAVLDWVATGGRLYVCREEGDDSSLPDLAFLDGEEVNRGFGTIRRWTRTGFDLDIEATQDELARNVFAVADALDSDYDRSHWALSDPLPEVAIRKGLFIGFLVLFAIVVGPVNLFVLAREPNRYRLFWTTPALSVGASVAILLLILLQDGVGGSGHQIAAWHHLPDENKATFLQEQVSRTALLLNRDFAIETPVSLSRLTLPSSSLTGFETVVGHGNYGGDWFVNRSIQGHFIEGVTATRWRLEAASPQIPGTAPELISTFPFTLESVFYRDADGALWHAADLAAGEPVRLQPVDTTAFDDAWNAFMERAGSIVMKRIEPLATRTEYFFAFTRDHPETTLQTLDAIDWETRSTLHIGPLAGSNP